MKVRYSKRALRDLDSILTYLSARSPSGATNVARRIYETVDHLSRQPRSGRETTRQGLRVFAVTNYPYLIFYRVADRHVGIVHVRHAARRPYVDE